MALERSIKALLGELRLYGAGALREWHSDGQCVLIKP